MSKKVWTLIWRTKGGKPSSERSGAHFRSGSEMVSEEFGKRYTKGPLQQQTRLTFNLECR